MTWFEAEQIDLYVQKMEHLLDEWRLSPAEMRIEDSQLSRVMQKVEVVSNDDTNNPLLRGYLAEMRLRIDHCRGQIQERLKRK